MGDYRYRIIRSRRKSISLEISREGEVIVRGPYSMRDQEAMRLIRDKENWIRKHLDKVSRARQAASGQRLTGEEIRDLADLACRTIPPLVRQYALLLHVSYGRITIRSQRTRWGSCSSRGNLNFNCLLMLAPEGVLRYVVVHELCHRIEMNHSPRFWAQVEKAMPDYRVYKGWLKDHGTELMARMTG